MADVNKKTWVAPQLVIIGSDPLQAKNNPAIREATGHYVTLNSVGYKAIVNIAGTKAFAISKNSNHVANRSDLIS